MAMILLACVTLNSRAADNTPPDGFTAPFTGKDLAGFIPMPDDNGHWKVANGIIDYDGKSESKGDKCLWSAKEYGDMTLMIDWRWSGPAKKVKHPIILPDGTYKKGPDGKEIAEEVDECGDSGVYLRGSSKSQVNMWCWNCGSGEVYGYRTDKTMSPEVIAGVTPKKKMDKPLGEWNTMTITIKGERLWVSLNGEEVITNAELPKVPAKGKFALQHHGDPIQFKNVYVKEL